LAEIDTNFNCWVHILQC